MRLYIQPCHNVCSHAWVEDNKQSIIGVTSVAVSSDGNTIISGSWDKTIKVWDLKSGQLLQTLTGHSSSVTSVTVSSDGNTIISGSEDKTIKLWNTQTFQLLCTLHCDTLPTCLFCSNSN